MYKKLLSYILVIIITISIIPVSNATAIILPSFITSTSQGLFVHGATDDTDTEAWQIWQNKMEEENREDRENKQMIDVNPNIKYFFMPSGAPENQALVYNGFDESITINSTLINSKSTAVVNYETDTSYPVEVAGENYTLIFKKSTAEAAIYVNNTDADGNGTELYQYLSNSKDNSASATGAIVDSTGNVDNTPIKKIKGRGNTTWKKAKKPFNITYDDNVDIDGMGKGKKFSLLANYQDGALIRNRILYDLSDAVGMPYSSESRFVDFYMNGIYYGSYQICQKIEVGKNDLINDIDDEAYLNEDGTYATDFPFLMEIDPSASEEDFNFSVSNNRITVKAPELSEEDKGYSRVKYYVTSKFTKLMNTLKENATKENLEAILDIDSFTKIYLINELGKNWDSGVSSLYMVYKQDQDGNWKFFASPVWDYDNSLGNSLGVEYELESMNLTTQQYTGPTEWWCKKKGSSSNVIKRIATCKYIQTYSSQIWFENFVPALNILNSENIRSGEIYSADVYYDILKGTADCNYTRGWFLDTNDAWIADHNELIKGTYNPTTHQYQEDNQATTYPVSFKGEYDYCIDWLTSRSGWLSAQLKPEYIIIGDANLDDVINIKDVTQIQRIVAGYTSTDKQIKSSDTNGDGTINVVDATYLQKKLIGLI